MLAQLEPVSTDDFGLPRAMTLFEDLRLKNARLMGHRESLLSRKAELTLKVAQAKGRQELEDEVKKVFEALQEKAHRRSIGPYEELLSACVRDVFPEKADEIDADKGIVKLTLGQSRGMPALDLYINNNGFPENILDANGGSINNVVVAGLRVSALSQTANRRLLVMDEPDIWIKPERVPNFVKMLSEVATNAKTQILMISHHVPEYFEGHASIIKLFKENDEVKATVLEPRVADWESDDVPGIRYMTLINVRAHRNTTIPFMPGLNSFIGDNNLGKSTALIAGLRAVAYNDADDTLFTHDRSENKNEILEAKIILGLEQGKRIEYTRHVKKSPKVIYRIFEGDEMVFEGRPPTRGEVPEAIEKLLGIRKVDGLDIQLRNQKSPIFLLDESDSTRAKLLSVGRESGHFMAVNEAYRKLQKADSKTVNDGEEELTLIERKLAILDRLVPLQGLLAIHGQLAKRIENAESSEKLLRKTIETIVESKRTADLCARKRDILARLPAVPVLEDTSRLHDLLTKIEVLGPKAQLELKPLALAVPTVVDNSRLKLAADRIEGLSKKASLAVPELRIAVPQLPDLSKLQTAIDRLTVLGRRAELVVSDLKVSVPVIEDNSRLIEVGVRLVALKKKSDLLDLLPPVKVTVPLVESNEAMMRTVVQMERLTAAGTELAKQFADATREEEEQQVINADLKKQIGNFCPLCEGLLPEGGLVHAH
jgi:DNA repair exonuclease SbcCD ATPase subunit